MRLGVRPAVWVLISLGACALAFWVFRAQRQLQASADLHGRPYAGASSCTRCHRDHAGSFARTFHRTMTQDATEDSVLGDFDQGVLEYFGVRARMQRLADGRFLIRYGGERIAERRWIVEKTIGSRRYQQYAARVDDTWVRLPVAWHIEEQRWFHMNGAFLTPDPVPANGLDAADYERHLTRWNDNCIFCHNVAPNPGRRVGAAGEPTFDSRVAEQGVACEACHGPGQDHGRANQDPVRRYVLHLGGAADPTIVSPARLPPDRVLDLCGRCHGQRITDDVGRFLAHGDPFVPGDNLAAYSAPIWRDTPFAGDAEAFAPRFWPDGTPRLTAYEYQGVLLSACAQRGSLTCLDCHSMHAGDPRGQLRPDRLGAAMCTSCHDGFTGAEAQRRHAAHKIERGAPSCVDCHMPKIVYGVLDAHPTHRILRPDPAQAARSGRPDACTLCHVDKSRRWAAEARARLWPSQDQPSPTWPASSTASGPRIALSGERFSAGLRRSSHQAEPAGALASRPANRESEVETALFAGDPIERALAAAALARVFHQPARPDAQGPADPHAADGEASRARVQARLLDVMERDPYPAVRHFAWRALPALPASIPYRPEATPAQRQRWVQALYETLRLPRPDADLIASLRKRAQALAIQIGE